MLAPEIAPQVDDLPGTQADQHEHGQIAEPLHTVVGALVCISKLLLPCAQVVHLGNDLGDDLFKTAQFCLDRLELLASLDGGPVLSVGADVNVEFNVTGGVQVARGLCARLEAGMGTEEGGGILPVSTFSKHTSNAESACEVNAYLFSP